MITRPMLAGKADNKDELATHMPYKVLASPKIDGIRCLLHPDLGAISRKFKDIPNDFIRTQLSQYQYLDGEIVTFTNGVLDEFNTIQSKVMSFDGAPQFKFLVFDSFKDENAPFVLRLNTAKHIVKSIDSPNIEFLKHDVISDHEMFMSYAAGKIAEGFEGAMYRHVEGLYKSGRSTLRQGWLVKWKNFQDAEGRVTDFIEQMHNENQAKPDNFGLIERSSHNENMIGKNTLGALVITTVWGKLRVGTGFDDAMRQEIWNNKEEYLHKTITFKYQPYGSKDLPRFPVFKGFRYD